MRRLVIASIFAAWQIAAQGASTSLWNIVQIQTNNGEITPPQVTNGVGPLVTLTTYNAGTNQLWQNDTSISNFTVSATNGCVNTNTTDITFAGWRFRLGYLDMMGAQTIYFHSLNGSNVMSLGNAVRGLYQLDGQNVAARWENGFSVGGPDGTNLLVYATLTNHIDVLENHYDSLTNLYDIVDIVTNDLWQNDGSISNFAKANTNGLVPTNNPYFDFAVTGATWDASGTTPSNVGRILHFPTNALGGGGGATFNGGYVPNNFGVSNDAPTISLTNNAYTTRFWMKNAGNATEFYFDKQTVNSSQSSWTDAVSRVAHWDMEQTNATTTLDVSGNSRNASNMPTAASGPAWSIAGTNPYARVEHCFDFDGSDDYFIANDDNAFTFTSGGADTSFTVMAWVNLDEKAATHQIISKFQTREWHFFCYAGGALYGELYSEGGTTVYIGRGTGNILSTGVWFHAALNYSGSKSEAGIDIYKDGVVVDTVSDSSGTYKSMTNTASEVWIGARYVAGTYQYMDGRIDDVRVYSPALTSNQIWTIAQQTLPLTNVEWRTTDTMTTTTVSTLWLTATSNGIPTFSALATNNTGIAAGQMWNSNGIMRIGP